MQTTKSKRDAYRCGIHRAKAALAAALSAGGATIGAQASSCITTQSLLNIRALNNDSHGPMQISYAYQLTMSERASGLISFDSVTTKRISTAHMPSEQAHIARPQAFDTNYPLVR